MSTGRTYWDWRGKPTISLNGAARYVAAAGGAWTGGDTKTAVSLATLAAQATSIGRDVFDDRFAGPPWSLPDLTDASGTEWYQRPDPGRPFDSYARARLFAR